MKTSEKTEQVSASLFAVGRDITPPKKNAKADTGKYSYTYLDLPALIEHLRPLLASWQLFVTQEVTGGPGFVEVTTTVWHLSGQFIQFGPTFIPAQGDAQQTGKAITYGRRYSLAAALNIAADEDDAAAPRSKWQSSANASTSLASGGGGETTDRPGTAVARPATAAGSPDTSGLPPDRGTAPADEPFGEGGTTAGAAPHYLTDAEAKALAGRMALSKNELLKEARSLFGERIHRVGDITHEMAKEMAP